MLRFRLFSIGEIFRPKTQRDSLLGNNTARGRRQVTPLPCTPHILASSPPTWIWPLTIWKWRQPLFHATLNKWLFVFQENDHWERSPVGGILKGSSITPGSLSRKWYIFVYPPACPVESAPQSVMFEGFSGPHGKKITNAGVFA